jgi:hypothetical protein
MDDEKSLDDALDEIDSWGEKVVEALAGLSPAEVVAYFQQTRARLEEQAGKPLPLTERGQAKANVA